MRSSTYCLVAVVSTVGGSMSLWSREICFFRPSLRTHALGQWGHLKGFSPVCSKMCALRSLFWANGLGQYGHLKGRSPVWPRMCRWRLSFVAKALGQCGHWRFLSLECRRMCFCRLSLVANALGQCGQLWLRSLEWRRMCFCRLSLVAKAFGQCGQLRFRSFECLRMCFWRLSLVANDFGQVGHSNGRSWSPEWVRVRWTFRLLLVAKSFVQCGHLNGFSLDVTLFGIVYWISLHQLGAPSTYLFCLSECASLLTTAAVLALCHTMLMSCSIFTIPKSLCRIVNCQSCVLNILQIASQCSSLTQPTSITWSMLHAAPGCSLVWLQLIKTLFCGEISQFYWILIA